MKLKLKTLFFILIIASTRIICQESNFVVPDSLKKYDYSQLEESYLNVFEDTLKSEIYLKTILNKSKLEGNKFRMAQAYCNLSYYAEQESRKLSLLDSSISISSRLKNKIHLILSYSFKGGYFLDGGKYDLALDNFLKALEYSEKEGNTDYVNISTHNIAYIKGQIGKHKEALSLFKNCLSNLRKNKTRDTIDYSLSLLYTGESYMKNNILDSATALNREGIRYIKGIDNEIYGNFVFNQGINLFHQGNYYEAKDSIDKGVSYIDLTKQENIKNLVLLHLYSGRLNKLTNQESLSIEHFIKLDSILQNKLILVPEARQSYEYLINYYKKKDDKNAQLLYISKLIRFDSILNHKKYFISNKLYHEYDTPSLIKEKQNLIKGLEKDKKKVNYLLIFFVLISSVISILFYVEYSRRKKYKSKFNSLINESLNQTSKTVQGIHKEPKNVEEEEKGIGIPDKIVDEILKGLDEFEKNKNFLKQNITTGFLAKKIGTNSKYLSKAVKHHRGKTFILYINDLRIEYVINILKENKKIRSYTIQGIAEESGFNTGESFSSAFSKKTGIKPSYYIKQLNELDK